jgi:predicted MPP superfamily phosphohydrolase
MMFGIIFTTAITICHLYVCWRAASLPFFRGLLPQKSLTIAGLLLWLLFISGLFYGHNHNNPLAHWLTLIGMTWMGVLFLLTSSLLIVELLTGLGRFFPNLVLPLRGTALTVGLLLSGIALYQGNRAPVLSNFEVTLPSLPAELDGAVVVVMSDLHLGTLNCKEWLAARISQVHALHPDLVLLVGDIFEGHGRPPEETIDTMRTLTATFGVWGVPGNHEFYGGPETIYALEEGGIRLLRNSWTEIRPGLVLAGVEEHTFTRRPEDGVGLISKTLTARPAGTTILLSHKPWLAEEAARSGVELMLSGHTHAGQIWPFNYLVKRFFPLLAGRYTVNNMPVLVCRGTGTWGAPMRLWQPSEIMKIIIRTKH